MSAYVMVASDADLVDFGNVFGMGFTGAEIPIGSAIYPSLSLPDDAAKIYWPQVTTQPVGAQLFMWEDGSFDFVAPAEGDYTFDVTLWEDGIELGTFVVTVTAIADVALGADAQAIATAAAALTVSITLAGAQLAGGAAAGGLTISVPLTAAAVTQALVSGALTIDFGAAGELHADARVSAVVQGDMTTINLAPALQGAATGSMQVSAQLTAPESVSLQAAGAASGQGAATMSGGSLFTPPRAIDALYRAVSPARTSFVARPPSDARKTYKTRN